MLTIKNTSSCHVTDVQCHSDQFQERKDGKGDLSITVHGQSTSAHTNVLKESSEYFETMFSGRFAESHASSIDLSELFNDIRHLDAVIDYMYIGEITLTEENIRCVLNAACHFLHQSLQDSCEAFLRVNMSPSTCLSILALAERYSMEELQGMCLEMIRSWFPFYLCKRADLISLSPHSLKILLEEGVFDSIPRATRRDLLKRWNDKFTSEKETSTPLPSEVEEAITREVKAVDKEQFSRPDTRENVIFAVFKIPETDESKVCSIEVHAFIPIRKVWKLVLRHRFSSPIVEPEAVPYFIGMTKTRALFMFTKEDVNDSKECIISVNFESGEEKVLNPPSTTHGTRGGYGDWPHYVLWGDRLYAIFDGLTLYKESDESWVVALELPEIGSSAEFIMETLSDSLFVWVKENYVCGSSLGYITYRFFEITKTPDAGEGAGTGEKYAATELDPVEKSDPDNGDYVSYGLSTLCCTTPCTQSGSILYAHIVDSNGDLGNGTENQWHEEFSCEWNMFSTNSCSWSSYSGCEIEYPEYEAKAAQPKNEGVYERKWPMVRPCKLLLRSDADEKDWRRTTLRRRYPEALIGGQYYLRTVSPYTTIMWELETDEDEWQVLTHLPFSLELFPHFHTASMVLTDLIEMPDSQFDDVTCELGHSALAENEIEGADRPLEFKEKIVPAINIEKAIAKVWREKLK